jgi:hypothetical protein
MRIDRQTDPASLAAYGVEAVRLLRSGKIDALANRFGYALAYGREPAAAIREDLKRCLTELSASSLAPSHDDPVPTVKYFEPNDTKLFALVECRAAADNGSKVLVELIVAGDESARHISLEDISAA